MQVTAKQIKALREETGAGIMDVKKALTESAGDAKKAREWLKQQGLEKAEKKAGRETGVTRVFSYVHFNGSIGSMVKLACETDFVAKTDDFAKLGKELAMQTASMNPKSVEELLAQDYLRESSKTVEQLVKEVSGKTGENVRVLEISRLG